MRRWPRDNDLRGRRVATRRPARGGTIRASTVARSLAHALHLQGASGSRPPRRSCRPAEDPEGVTAGGPARLKIATPPTRSPGRSTTTSRSPTGSRRRPGHAAALQLRRLHRPAVVKSFEKQYGVEVKIVSTFNDTDEALHEDPHRAGPYDIYFPSYDQIGRRWSTAELIRPLNQSTSPTSPTCGRVPEPLVRPVAVTPCRTRSTRPASAGATTRSPRTSPRSTTPTTCSGTRSTPASWRSSTTGTPRWRWSAAARRHHRRQHVEPEDLQHDQRAADSRCGRRPSPRSPSRCTTTCRRAARLGQMWSGDIVNAQYYLPKGSRSDVLRYWFPEDGKGLVDNDLMVVLADGNNPVLAHLFIDHMLDDEGRAAATSGSSATSRRRTSSTPTGWSPTATCRRTSRPPSVQAGVVRHGYRLLELPPAPTRPGTRSGSSSRQAPDSASGAGHRRFLWPPLAAARRRSGCCCSSWRRSTSCWPSSSAGRPDLPHAVPVWNPVEWNTAQFSVRLRATSSATTASSARRCSGPRSTSCPRASCACSSPTRSRTTSPGYAGRWRGLLLALLIAPFWISYMMRMLAWVNLLQTDGLVNRCSARRLLPVEVDWLDGRCTWSSSDWSTATSRT